MIAACLDGSADMTDDKQRSLAQAKPISGGGS
jgi:hypothetical protein